MKEHNVSGSCSGSGGDSVSDYSSRNSSRNSSNSSRSRSSTKIISNTTRYVIIITAGLCLLCLNRQIKLLQIQDQHQLDEIYKIALLLESFPKKSNKSFQHLHAEKKLKKHDDDEEIRIKQQQQKQQQQRWQDDRSQQQQQQQQRRRRTRRRIFDNEDEYYYDEKNKKLQPFDDKYFDEVVWPNLQHKLCPAGVPNVNNFGHIIFEMARKELNIKHTYYYDSNSNSDSDSNSDTTDSSSSSSKGDGDDYKNKDSSTLEEIKRQQQQQQKEAKTKKKKKIKHSKEFSNNYFSGLFGSALWENKFINKLKNNNNKSLYYGSIWGCGHNEIINYIENILLKNNKNINNNNNFRRKRNNYYNQEQQQQQQQQQQHNLYSNTDLEKVHWNKTLNSPLHPMNKNTNIPCIFTVIRDPILHFLTGYNKIEHDTMMKYNNNNNNNNTNTNTNTNQQLLVAAAAAAAAAPYTNITNTEPVEDNIDKETIDIKYHYNRERRFKQLVIDLVSEHDSFFYGGGGDSSSGGGNMGDDGDDGIYQSSSAIYNHIAPMSRILTLLNEYDLLPSSIDTSWILPTMNNLSETFPIFLKQQCPNAISNLMFGTTAGTSNTSSSSSIDSPSTKTMSTTMPKMIKHDEELNTISDEYGTYKAAKDVWAEDKETSRVLCLLHSFDYACFSSILPYGIPKVCREDVYGSKLFIEKILVSNIRNILFGSKY